jgi:transcriptional regulator with XRE-family HTH domain
MSDETGNQDRGSGSDTQEPAGPSNKEIGLQLRAVREKIGMTLEAVGKEAGISRSYLSDFERGYRPPTTKYLRYLHNRHNVNLNFLFCSEGRKFRPLPKDVPPDFGRLQDEVDKLLRAMEEMPHLLYAVLGFFTEYKLMNKELIERQRTQKDTAADSSEG